MQHTVIGQWCYVWMDVLVFSKKKEKQFSAVTEMRIVTEQ